MNNVFVNDIKVIQNKMRRIEKDRISKISLDTLTKEHENKLRKFVKDYLLKNFLNLFFVMISKKKFKL